MQSVKDDGVEVVFVSDDGNEAAMMSYMETQGDWWAVEFGSEANQALPFQLGVRDPIQQKIFWHEFWLKNSLRLLLDSVTSLNYQFLNFFIV